MRGKDSLLRSVKPQTGGMVVASDLSIIAEVPQTKLRQLSHDGMSLAGRDVEWLGSLCKVFDISTLLSEHGGRSKTAERRHIYKAR
jgi:hypothetical protein